MSSNQETFFLTEAVDRAAEHAPQRLFALVPKGSNVEDGFRHVSIKDLANAVNYASYWIEKLFGRSERHETVAYVGASDIRYAIFVLACIKTGYRALLPSTKNSPEAMEHLLKVTGCGKILFGPERKDQTFDLTKLSVGVEVVESPSLDDFLYSTSSHYDGGSVQMDDTAFIIHSSGTTGMPKPVVYTHNFVKSYHETTVLPRPAGRRPTFYCDLTSNDLVLVTTPFFHGLGFYSFFESILHGIPFVHLPDKPVSVDLLVNTIRTAKPTAAVLSPSMLEDMSQSPEAIDCLETLKTVYFGGAPLAPDVGNQLCKRVPIVSLLGASELGLVLSLIPESSEDWQYFEWNPAYGVDMQETESGMYELVIQRATDSTFQGAFHTFPELTEYRTKDLFSPHPTKPGLWRYQGRTDDIIVLSNGEKFNPISMEKIIDGHPMVSHSLVIGQGRFQPALLIELDRTVVTGTESNEWLLDTIWPIVKNANKIAPAHGRVMKNMVRFAAKDKPFQLTPKGSVKRTIVNEDYRDEIESIYFEGPSNGCFAITNIASTIDYIRTVVVGLLDKPTLGNTDDIYAAGFDSLQTVQLARILNSIVSPVTPQHIYSNHTVERLAVMVHDIDNGTCKKELPREQVIDSMVERFTVDIPRQTCSPNVNSRHSVLLTGSTGSLGTYILHSLLEDPMTDHVYCLNRSEAKSRQGDLFAEKGFTFDTYAEKKTTFLKVSFGEDRFGLDNETYAALANNVDTIIHNAWKVDFNHPLSSFEEHIKGVRNFVDLSIHGRYHPHIHFISSIGTIGGMSNTGNSTAFETAYESPEAVLHQGYSESKHVAERICLAASRIAGAPCTILRVGQIAGPTTEKGLWNPQEWVPSLVKTSKALGQVPDSLGSQSIEWIPVDKLGQIVTDIITHRRKTQHEKRLDVYHLVNPSSTSWSSLIPAIERHYGLALIRLSSWIDELKAIRNPSVEDISAMPALKLLDFYASLIEDNAAFSTSISCTNAKNASTTMQTLGPISDAHMDTWIGQWGF